ncbi:uncharacterized protein Eint_020100 [Encephalitozoon intestinalis ATCC 50506]|uniref:Uncharacterized protein n=1 Tax=Encephalitozoon intestinalis (strain ATCC 50506) TaxID=876142 RepID=E0S5M6_ENCIT|nr:uncharacterized protein Eint_020100 [Encephalitozoon intestinalis ATCC 50506]ADM11011.2 hypothetical protein Eint_020100 [Encephalitozoon intestinalis ATCC 50506]UTX44657.1 hypothetical protein GPK93_02g01720 [Encephalitozoon intestinalis]
MRCLPHLFLTTFFRIYTMNLSHENLLEKESVKNAVSRLSGMIVNKGSNLLNGYSKSLYLSKAKEEESEEESSKDDSSSDSEEEKDDSEKEEDNESDDDDEDEDEDSSSGSSGGKKDLGKAALEGALTGLGDTPQGKMVNNVRKLFPFG